MVGSKLISVNVKEDSSVSVTKNVKLRCHQILSPFLLPFWWYSLGDTFEDIDECRTGTPCGDLMCVNTIGSYECICPNGFTHDDGLRSVFWVLIGSLAFIRLKLVFSCRDIDECTETNNCGFYGCSNFPGGYICECPVNSLWNPFRMVYQNCSTCWLFEFWVG